MNSIELIYIILAYLLGSRLVNELYDANWKLMIFTDVLVGSNKVLGMQLLCRVMLVSIDWPNHDGVDVLYL